MLLNTFQAFRSGKGFLYTLFVFVSGWIGWNYLPGVPHFDRPEAGDAWLLLNLVLSMEAAFSMPIILMAQAVAQKEESAKLKEVLLSTRELLARMGDVQEDLEEMTEERDVC